ncbi:MULTISPECIES: TonB-dependent receptor [Bacteroidota]|jgi:iron complex outermembrane receptor protein|uniref:Energy transducer TonB n=8 Tax=Flavobacteriales TaxID=200644 RepID=A0A0J7J2A0_9FLAO|nr:MULTISPECIES: TonB-dependent receptor [Bacteroidota]OJU74886.1 MAG: energy transducer TonB [Bacteroidetes bacterium 47-18]PZR23348.1 MAG: TonB-dependent receptor [Citrobacter freundii]KMQ72186.1 energy transducer TonB [Chryseobacterium koreense CCUG 49689]KUJ57405.1 energy transducer TonB [Chryseobacterium aquaticum subsp. greenlandense]MBB5331917.1 iron complex outermembrane receptor protein [Chryseobacterium koreense]
MNLKSVLLLVAFVSATLNIFAQNRISGTVKDQENNKNLAGVSVYIADLKAGTTTDVNGNYEIKNLKRGTYLLEISFTGYEPIIEKITIAQDTVMDFVLSPAITELNELIITGVTRSTELRLSPVIVKAVDGNTLKQNSATNLIDGLRNIPGVNQITTGTGISKPTIRGLGYNRVITLNNGIRQEGQQWGDEHGIEIDENAVDRVEVVKGPGSLMYGSDGIAGVLNFLAPKALPIGEIKTQVSTNYQSNNNLIGYSLSNAGNKDGLQWLGRFSNKFAGNYQNAYDGKVFNSGFKELNGSLFLGINKRWGHSHLTVSSYNNTLNLVEGERDELGRFIYENANGDEVVASGNDYKGYKVGFPHQTINHLGVSSNNYFILNKGTINADFGFQNNKRREYENPAAPNEPALFFDLNTLNYNVRYNFEKSRGWETSVGIGGMWQSNTNRGEEFLIPAYNLFDAGAFLFTQKTFGKLTLAGGLRFDNRSMNSKELYLNEDEEPVQSTDPDAELKFSAFNKNYNGVSGSLGLSYQVDKNSTLKFNVSRGFRAPNSTELSANGRHEGTFRYLFGTPDLKSEISHQIDVAYFLNSKHITLELTPFVNFIQNYIYLEKLVAEDGTEIIPDPVDGAPAFQYTAGNATLVGGEIYLDIHPQPIEWLHLENSFSYVQATQSSQPESSKYLPFIPAPRYRGEIKAELRNVNRTFSNAYIKFGINHFFQQDKFFSAYGTETATPAYTLLSAGIGTNIKAFNRSDFMSLFISGENLADVAYQSHLSRLKYAPENPATGRMGVFNMGRNISVKLIMNF